MAVDLVRSMRRWDLVAIVVNGVIGAGIFGLPSKVYGLVGSYSLLAFCVCAACVLLIVYSFAELALPILRSRNDAPPAAYTVPGGKLVAYAAVIVCICLLSSSTLREARDTAIAVLIGALLSFARFHPAKVDRREVAC